MAGAEAHLARGLTTGDVVAQKFVVEGTIGRGGMGQVVVARHRELGTKVAIKVVHADLASDPETLVRFKREARAMAKLTSDHTVRVYDVGETESGLPYMIMDHLEGRDFGSILKEGGALPIDEAVEAAMQAADALIEAHENGIVHRDLKPQNLFLTRKRDGEMLVRVLDFGLALPFAGFDSLAPGKLTQPGLVIGTSQYMAPEQITEGVIDVRTDVWGLGATLFRLLTDKHPFATGPAPFVCASILKEPPKEILTLRPEVPRAVGDVVRRCLEKDPARRFSSMRELLSALRAARDGIADVTQLDLVPNPEGGQTTLRMVGARAPSAPRGVAPVRRRSSLTTVVVATGVLAAASGGIALVGRGNAARSPATPITVELSSQSISPDAPAAADDGGPARVPASVLGPSSIAAVPTTAASPSTRAAAATTRMQAPQRTTAAGKGVRPPPFASAGLYDHL